MCKHGRLITRSRADLENLGIRTDFHKFCHYGHDVRLGDRLSVTDRKRCVVIGVSPNVSGYEDVPGHSSHRVQDRWPGDGCCEKAWFLNLGANHAVARHQAGRRRILSREAASPVMSCGACSTCPREGLSGVTASPLPLANIQQMRGMTIASPRSIFQRSFSAAPVGNNGNNRNAAWENTYSVWELAD